MLLQVSTCVLTRIITGGGLTEAKWVSVMPVRDRKASLI